MKDVLFQPTQPSTRVAELNLETLMDSCGCETPNHCLLHFTLRGNGTKTWQSLSAPKDAVGMKTPNLRVSTELTSQSNPRNEFRNEQFDFCANCCQDTHQLEAIRAWEGTELNI